MTSERCIKVENCVLEFKHTDTKDFLKIKLLDAIEPFLLKQLKIFLDETDYSSLQASLLLITGRAPIWLYSFLTHYFCHIYQIVAIFDPKVKGYVIVSSHDPKYKEGDILEVK